eukprot:12260180-Alexandrium_andersonii.AAC.1
MSASLVGSEMCIRDRAWPGHRRLEVQGHCWIACMLGATAGRQRTRGVGCRIGRRLPGAAR